MIGSVTSYKIQELKKRLGIETQLTINYTSYEKGSKKILEKGTIQQDASGELQKNIITMASGSIGVIKLRLIYTDWPTKEPTIKIVNYENN